MFGGFLSRCLEQLRSFYEDLEHRRYLATSKTTRLGSFRLRGESLEDRSLLSISTTTTLHSYPTSSNFGQPVDLVAHVSTNPASSWDSGPTGSVTFWLNGVGTGTNLGTANVSHGGTARLETETLPVGTVDNIFASYGGDATFAASQTADPVADSVAAASSHVELLASSNPGVTGTDVTFTAIVSGSQGQGFDGWRQGGWFGWGSWHGWEGWHHESSTPGTPPTGTVSFAVDGGASVAGTFVGNSGGKAIYTFTTSTLTAGSHTVTASYAGDSNYNASTSQTLTEQIVAPTAGSVTAGSNTSPLSLRDGQSTFSVNVSQDPANMPIASGTATYVNSAHGINLTNAAITSVVFSSNGHQAEITGTATNVNGSTSTPVTFTMLVNSGNGEPWSRPSLEIEVIGDGIDYHNFALVSRGDTIAVNGTGTTSIPQLANRHDFAFQSVFADWGSWFDGWDRGWWR